REPLAVLQLMRTASPCRSATAAKPSCVNDDLADSATASSDPTTTRSPVPLSFCKKNRPAESKDLQPTKTSMATPIMQIAPLICFTIVLLRTRLYLARPRKTDPGLRRADYSHLAAPAEGESRLVEGLSVL